MYWIARGLEIRENVRYLTEKKREGAVLVGNVNGNDGNRMRMKRGHMNKKYEINCRKHIALSV
jgi:hypothetical protein